MTDNYNEIINNATSIVITAHKSPDGDAIGSSLALYSLLKEMGKTDVTVIVPDSFPTFLDWMEGSETIVYYDSQTEEANKIFSKASLIFSLDYNALIRIGDMAEAVKQSSAIKIMIDHHQDPQDFADHYFVDTDCCSTAQLIYEFAEKLNYINYITAGIASCIYSGIMTDTGSFRYPSTTAKTHEIIANLITLGADGAKIHQDVYDNNTESRLQLLGHALSNKMKVLPTKKAAFISLTQQELKDFNFQKGDTEGLVNYPLSINGIKFSVLMTEKEDYVSMSFRSKEDVYVNLFAKENFSGGGHVYAAGGISKVSLEETILKLESLINENDFLSN